jgi:ParB family chromosome partitioning protein
MADKTSRDSLKAKGKRDAYMFDPDDLVLVTDEKSPLYDERVNLPVDEGLVLNIMHAPDGAAQGVLEPINATRNPETGKVEVIDGRQRVKAAREANKRLRKAGMEPVWVPAMLKRTNAYGAMGMLISSNEHRQNDSPLGRAKKAQRYLDLGRDESEIAALFGISAASVKNMLSLLDAPAAVRNAVEAGKISTSDGYKLSKLEPEEARVKVAELMEKAPRTPGKKRSSNSKAARAIVSGGKEPKISKKAEDAVATDIAAWIDEHYEDLGDDMLKGIRGGEWRKVRGEK